MTNSFVRRRCCPILHLRVLFMSRADPPLVPGTCVHYLELRHHTVLVFFGLQGTLPRFACDDLSASRTDRSPCQYSLVSCAYEQTLLDMTPVFSTRITLRLLAFPRDTRSRCGRETLPCRYLCRTHRASDRRMRRRRRGHLHCTITVLQVIDRSSCSLRTDADSACLRI